MKWICCQLGAREHFAIPRALFRKGLLECLLTDAWIAPQSLLGKLCGHRSKLKKRFHNELLGARLKTFTWSLVLFETLSRARGLGGWPRIIARDRWFQRKVISFLDSHLSTLNSQPILLSYSYAALEPFRYARARKWKTLLVQIDPGPEEEKIVAEEALRVPELVGEWQPAPAEYWVRWREECKLADCIVVNSEWSRERLLREGVSAEKMSVIPLAYDAPKGGDQKSEVTNQKLHGLYPAHFSQERPLRVLFLGLINLRKGVARLLEAARILRDEPVEFWMVGPVEIANATATEDIKRVKWFGPVSRNQAAEFYRDADVFILPTLSDGFAITQLEAQAHGLPIIASKFCGKVVQDGVNGIILEEPTAKYIAQAVRYCITDLDRLRNLAAESRLADEFTIQSLAHSLHELGGSL